MGKNYTLYIKYPEFDDEKNKSGLVNRLYNEHLNSVSSKVAELRSVGIDSTVEHESTEDGMVAHIKPNSKDVAAYKRKIKEMGIKFCQHGYAPHLCKFAKPGKPCKEK